MKKFIHKVFFFKKYCVFFACHKKKLKLEWGRLSLDFNISTTCNSIATLSSSLTPKYRSVYEGLKQLDDVDEIKRVFVEFQQHAYNVKVA